MTVRGTLLSWMKDRKGSVAVEFALVSIPFIYCTIAIIELSMYFAATNMLEGGISNSARIIRTGQLQQQTDLPPEEAFRNEVCNHIFGLIECDDLQIEVIAMPDDQFSSVGDYTPNYDEDGNFVPRDFDAGGSGDVVMIRAHYVYRLLTPLFAQILSPRHDGRVTLMSTVVLQSEPYDFNPEEDDA